MLRRITGLCTMRSDENVYVRDGEGPVASLHIGLTNRCLTREEMRHLAQCLTEAANRADERAAEQAMKTPADEQKDV